MPFSHSHIIGAECLLGKRGRNGRGMEEETSYVLPQKSVSYQAVKMVDSAGKSVRNLAETLHSLLGHKAHLTSNWVKSVCDIIKTLPISEKPVVLQPTDIDTIDDDDSACTTISKIKDELATLTNHINQLNIKRRQILNQFLDLKGNIRVFCRIRPIAVGENIGQLRPVVALDSNKVLLNVADNKSKSYEFDKVFHPGSSQDEVFSEVEPIIKSVLDGYNACIFAYGQTGTGKTFTMEGSTDAPGIVPQAIKALFKQAGDSNHAFLISFSMLEIYMGNLKDLLIPKPTKATDPMPPCLSIQADPEGGTEIDNLVSIKVNDFNQALRLYRLGCRFRSTASTNSNLTSSRSHCMIRIAITCFDAPERRRETNKIWLVDLGGSERMLKTKAWGKRLDEGKAINLSLSALGDVINALQRKKHHVPYRNSKLTQVLKDSLGDDSKTIMLVHVSPKEEDLCETICSLNFATRAKSIHLGNEDTVDVRKQKEVAMSDLQQKMKKIEDERLHVRSDIEKLNKKLENQTGTNSTSGEQLQTDHSCTEEPPTKNGIGNISADSLSKLPRFMRPTICSKRKMGTTYQTTEGGDDPVLVRRRRPSTRRAESVSFPVKNHSEYNSDCNISRSSCLARLNMKNSADNMTEYSQHMSETDVNIIGLQEGVPRSSNHQKAGISLVQKNGSRHMNKINHIKYSKVDNWLQKNEPPPVNVYTQRTKRVLAAPITEKKHKRNVQRKAEKFCDEKEHGCEFTMQKVVNHDQINNLVSTAGVGTPISEVVIEKPLKTLKDLFNEDSRSDVISPWGKTLIQTEDSADGSLARDNEFSTFSPPHGSCSRLDEYKDDDDGVNTMSIAQELEGRTQCPECFVPENCGCCECYPSELYTSFICSKRDAGVSISMLELESSCRQAATKSNTEDGERQDLNVPFQPFAKETKHGLLQLRAKRALFMKSENQGDFAVPFNKTDEKIQTTGLWHVVKQKIEILRASALLGLGFYSLGFEHDFFFGLML